MDDDDDFGDIYVDFDCQASSAINSTSNLGNLYTVPQEEAEEKGGECNDDTDAKHVDNRADEEDRRFLNSDCQKPSNSEDCMSDSDDDFNIVLNDEDCKGFSVSAERNGNQEGILKDENDDDFLWVKNGYVKNELNSVASNHGGERRSGVNGSIKLEQYGSLFSHNKVYESVGLASKTSNSVRDLWEDHRCKQHEVSNTGQLTSDRSSTNFAVESLAGGGFALPWYRTILDVNIDAFEEKRWKCPGVDVSDFFNFGFDEDSWKQYCISLEQLRQRLYLHKRFHNHDISHLPQAFGIRPGSACAPDCIAQAGSSSKFANTSEKLLGMPRGRAIQVEDGTGERQSKMDVMRPRIWDSDVVIQINVQDPGENLSGSCEDEVHHLDNGGLGGSIMNSNVDDIRDTHDSDRSSAEKSLKGSRSSSVKGFPLPVSESNKTNLAPDDHNLNVQTSEDIFEAIETVEKVEEERGRTFCKPDQHLTENELSSGDPSHFSLTLSCSESESEASHDSVCNLPGASPRFSNGQTSGAKLLESDASDCESPTRNVAVKKQDNHLHCSRPRSSIWDRRRHQNQRFHNVSEARRLPDVNGGASSLSRDILSVDDCRQTERQCDYGYKNRQNFSCDQKREFSGHFGGEIFAKIHSQDCHHKNTHLRYNQRFRDGRVPQWRRNWTEENFHEREIYDRDDLNEDWDSGERAPSPRGIISFSYGKSRRLNSKLKNFKETNIQWRRKRDTIESGMQTNDDIFWLEHESEDFAMVHKYGRSVLLNPMKRDSFREKYEMHIPSVRREAYLCERRDEYGYSPPMNLDSPWNMESEDQHWDLDRHNLSYCHHRESYAANSRRSRNKMLPRSEFNDPGLAERYGQHGQELGSENYRDYHWVENKEGSENYSDFHWVEINNDYDNVDDIFYSDDQAQKGRKHRWEPRILHGVECESILSQHDNITFAKRSSGSFEKSFGHGMFQSNYRSSNCCTTAGDVQLEGHRFEMFKGDSFLRRKPRMTCRDEHNRTARRYSYPVDLIFGEGKSSGRRPHAASLMANRKLHFVDRKVVKEQKVSRDFIGTKTRKATTQGSILKLSGGEYDNKPLDKFPVADRNEDFDIEEGQIVAEELIREGRLENKVASESTPCKQNKKIILSENVRTGNAIGKGYDEQRILDTLAKMERRRQRFQDPVALKKQPDSTMKPQIDLTADTFDNKQERPARKRRWGG